MKQIRLKRGKPVWLQQAGRVFSFSGCHFMRPDRTAELRSLLQRRILILDGAMGTMIQGYRLGEEADFAASASRDSRERPEGQQRPAGADPAAHHPRDPRAVSRRRRRHRSRPTPSTPTRRRMADYGLARPRVRTECRRRAPRARSRRRSASARRPTGRASSPACSARPPRPPRSRPTSTTRASATSRFDALVAAYLRSRRAASPTAARTCSWSKPSSTR